MKFDSVSEDIKKQEKIQEKLQLLLKNQDQIQRTIDSFKLNVLNYDDLNAELTYIARLNKDSIALMQSDISRLKDIMKNNVSYQIGEIIKTNMNSLNNFKSAILENVGSEIVNLVKESNDDIVRLLSESVKNMYCSLSYSLHESIKSSAIEWLQSIDLTPIQNIYKNLDIDFDIIGKYKKLNDTYLQAMYQCHWFPYAGWTVSIYLMKEVSDVLASSRGASKRREKRIDKIIFSYYTQSEIKKIKRNWKNSDLEPYIKKILGQAIEAHLRGEYVLTITCLSSMWETLIYYKAGITTPLQQKMIKENFKILVEENGFDDIFSDFYDNLILSPVNTPDEVIEGVPNRNGSSHGKYNKYPNKKASLNAILITDFIISLEPKRESEVIQNG